MHSDLSRWREAAITLSLDTSLPAFAAVIDQKCANSNAMRCFATNCSILLLLAFGGGCLGNFIFRGDSYIHVQQEAAITVRDTQTGNLVSNATIAGVPLGDAGKIKEPISTSDRTVLDETMKLGVDTGKTSASGTTTIDVGVNGSPDDQEHPKDLVTGRWYAFKIVAGEFTQYCSIQMRAGAEAKGNHFTLTIDSIGEPRAKKQRSETKNEL